MQRDKEDDEEMCKLVLSHTNSINLFNTMFLPVLIATTIETKKLRSDKTNIRRLIKVISFSDYISRLHLSMIFPKTYWLLKVLDK